LIVWCTWRCRDWLVYRFCFWVLLLVASVLECQLVAPPPCARLAALCNLPTHRRSPSPQVHGDYTAEAAAAAAASEKIERPAEEVVGLAPEEETA
jgi:hypothetical protein